MSCHNAETLAEQDGRLGSGTAEGADPPIGRGVVVQRRRKQVAVWNVFGTLTVCLRRHPAILGPLIEEGEG